MSKILFPSWRYHTDGRKCVIKNQEEADALGAGWSNSPTPSDPEPEIAPPAPEFAPGIPGPIDMGNGDVPTGATDPNDLPPEPVVLRRKKPAPKR
jgi:hypothetical protein